MEKLTISEMKKRMPPCPICGKKAFLSHDIVDGFDFGWSAGCPSYCLDDGVHGISEPYDPDAPKVDSHDPEIAVRKWSDYCERMKRDGRSDDP